ncbi:MULTISPECIES: multidrug efflux SMR transporter [unclassified Campylobacter]|uniref:DMT family transporter n=1 Tax=unclassified Campylobacter TaxID=2593542 RepID=UPI002B0617F5|nr:MULTISPECIES: multidrug efflux SMR transporter [unclassified Campylobacter]
MFQFNLSKNQAWFLLVLGGIVECFWVSSLKHSNSLLLYALTALGIIFSFSCAILAMKKIEVGISYSVFVGIGTSGTVILEVLVFNEEFSWLKSLLIFLLILGVIGLKISSKETHSKISKTS